MIRPSPIERDQQTAITLQSFEAGTSMVMNAPSFSFQEKLNAALELHLQGLPPWPVATLFDSWLEALTPQAAALFQRPKGLGWMLLAEWGAVQHWHPATEVPAQRYAWSSAESEWVLYATWPDLPPPPAEATTRAFLLHLALKEIAPVVPARPLAEKSSRLEVWHEVVGSRMRRILLTEASICQYAETVLILGETGTGKELVARGLHQLWQAPGEFVALNCAAIPADLLDAELFGIQAGTATGVNARIGRIEQAEGGTLFLDEVSELPLALQSKLLRVLQEREYFSLGGAQLKRAHLKIVATSNRSAQDLRAGQMRPDLFFRLTQSMIVLPPLRERTEDLAELCEYFLNRLEHQFRRGVKGLSLEALEQLKPYEWPGNIRELQNILRFLYAQAPSGGLIQSTHIPFTLRRPAVAAQTLETLVENLEREVIQRELQRTAHVAQVAQKLGLSEGYLYRKLKKLGLEVPKPPRTR